MNSFSRSHNDAPGLPEQTNATEPQPVATGAPRVLDFKDQRIRRMGQSFSSSTTASTQGIKPSATIWEQPKLRVRPIPSDLDPPVDIGEPIEGGEDSIPQLLRPLLRQWLDDNLRQTLAEALKHEDTGCYEDSVWKQPKSFNRPSSSPRTMAAQSFSTPEPASLSAADLLRPLLQEWLDTNMHHLLSKAAEQERSQ